MTWSDSVAALNDSVFDTFGVDIVYKTGSGRSHALTGIFDRAFKHLEGGEVGIDDVSPVVQFLERDLPAGWRDDDPTVTVDGVLYHVVGAPRVLGNGAVRFRLELP